MPVAEALRQPASLADIHFEPAEFLSRIYSARDYILGEIKEKLPPDFKPRVALTLGSGGLGDVAELIENPVIIPYENIPGFKKTTVEGHAGNLVVGYIAGVPMIGFQGRRHFYEEGPQPNQVIALKNITFPVYVARALGAEHYFATNAAGGLNSEYQTGDLMSIESHIDVYFPNPLAGPQVADADGNVFMDAFRFQPQNTEYAAKYRRLLKLASKNVGESEHLHEGVYCALPGPTYESRADSQKLRKDGADAVGMSTVPEVIVAANLGMDTYAFSLITNVIAEDGTNATSHDEVTAALKEPATKARITKIIREFFRLLAKRPQWLLNVEVDSSEITVDGEVYPYVIVKDGLEPSLPYTLGYVGAEVPFISVNVSRKYHRHILGHEIRHKTRYKDLTEEEACLKALEDELQDVKAALPHEYRDYIHERRVFFDKLVEFYETHEEQLKARPAGFLEGLIKARDHLVRIDFF